MTLLPCPNIGVDHNCWVVRRLDTVSKDVSVVRACLPVANHTCTSDHLDKEFCTFSTVTNIWECSSCCTGPACNTMVLQGGAAGLAVSFSALLAVAYAVLRQLQ